MDQIAQCAVELAGELAKTTADLQTSPRKAESARLARAMDDEAGKAFMLVTVDRVFRSKDPREQSRRPPEQAVSQTKHR